MAETDKGATKRVAPPFRITCVRLLILLPSLLLALSSFSAFASPAAIRLRVDVPPTGGEDGRTPFRVVISNPNPAPVQDFYVSVYGSAVTAMPEVCVQSFNSVSCIVDLPANGSRTLEFVGSSAGGRSFPVHAQSGDVHDYDQTHLGRAFNVTSLADSGPGSLRQAIEDANRECEGACVIAFRIDATVPPEGWFTIRPQSPLPPTTAEVSVDGRTQTEHSGDTNPAGPEIMLDGSALPEGHGLVLRGQFRVSDLSIGRFPGNGIETTGIGYARRNFLGTDPTGRSAAPNALRGISVTGGRVRLVDNVLSGNLRAGGFFETTEDIAAYGNLVGVGVDGVTPLGNGASGFFFHKPAQSHWLSFVYDNVFGYNAHAGIGVSMAANGNFAPNAFIANRGLPIDIGLDGESHEVRPGFPGQGGRIGAPRIREAQWNGAATIVEVDLGKLPETVTTGLNVYVHIGSAPDVLEEVVRVPFDPNGGFRLTLERDLRGKYVRASMHTVFIYNWDTPAAGTSELGAARQVQ